MTTIEQFDLADIMQAAGAGQKKDTGIYLGGAVSEFLEDSPSYAAAWREEFPNILSSFAEEGMTFSCYNPCEGQYNEELVYEQTEYNEFRFKPQFILDKCVHQMLMSDILVMNFLNCTDYFSPGTFWEMGFAFAIKGKYIVLIDTPDGKARNHPIIEVASHFIASSVYEAAQYCVYLDKKHTEMRL